MKNYFFILSILFFIPVAAFFDLHQVYFIENFLKLVQSPFSADKVFSAENSDNYFIITIM